MLPIIPGIVEMLSLFKKQFAEMRKARAEADE